MDYQRLLDLTEDVLILRGGRGSGNWALDVGRGSEVAAGAVVDLNSYDWLKGL